MEQRDSQALSVFISWFGDCFDVGMKVSESGITPSLLTLAEDGMW